jgi:hypothetical protein
MFIPLQYNIKMRPTFRHNKMANARFTEHLQTLTQTGWFSLAGSSAWLGKALDACCSVIG